MLATQALNHRATPSRGIMHGPHDRAATPRAAGNRIKSLEAAGDSAAARAQTVWARPQTSLPISRTRWSRNRLHISQANCPCRKRQRGLRTAKIKGSRPIGQKSATTMPASPLHRVVRRWEHATHCVCGVLPSLSCRALSSKCSGQHKHPHYSH